MEFKGTKGKWEVGKNYNDLWIEITCNEINIAEAKNYNNIPVSELHYNSKLIASAPEMLDILIYLSETMKDFDGWREEYNKIQEVIKKAIK